MSYLIITKVCMIYDDILEGLDGNDTLDGGSGNDKYKANKFDTIIDSDKKVAQIKV